MTEDDEIFLDGELIDWDELMMILRWLCIDMAIEGHEAVQIEHGEHLTLQ